MRRLLVLVVMILVAAAGCDEEVSTEPAANVQSEDSGNGSDDSTSDSSQSGADASSDGDSSGADLSTGDGGDSDPGPDDEDAADIVGNPDLDLDELAEIDPDTAEALDEIDDIVSIGECESETIMLKMTYVPIDGRCRVLDEAIGGLDGFTLFMPGNPGGVEITIGTPIPNMPSPCEALQACDSAVPIDLGGDFDVTMTEVLGIQLINGVHPNGAVLTVTKATALTDPDKDFIRMVLDGVQPC